MEKNVEKTSLTRAFNGVRIFWHYSFRLISIHRKNLKTNVCVAKVQAIKFTNYHQICA